MTISVTTRRSSSSRAGSSLSESGYDLAVMIRVGLAFYELGYKDAALNMMEMIKKPFEEADLMSECPPIVQEIIDKCISDEKNNQ